MSVLVSISLICRDAIVGTCRKTSTSRKPTRSLRKHLSCLIMISLLFCSVSLAELTNNQKTKLDEVLKGYSPGKPITCQSDLNQAIKGATAFLRTRILALDVGSDQGKWARALSHITEYLDIQAPKPEKQRETNQVYSRVKKYQSSEVLKKDLIEYLKSKFPIAQTASCSGESGPQNMELETKNISSILAVTEEASKSDLEVLSQGPRITGGMLFVDLLGDTTHQGWDLHMESIQTFRGNSGYTDQNGREQKAGDSARNQMTVALSNPVLGQLPLYQVNSDPVTLNQESEPFFQDLPKDMRSKTDGTWVGYRYILFPDALINTQHYMDPQSREPISIYLMKKVKPVTGKKYAINKEKLEKFEEKIQDEQNNHDLLNAALKLRKNEDTRESMTTQEKARNVERARALLKKLADEGLPRAQHELAGMYFRGEGGKKDLDKGNHYAALAHSHGLPRFTSESVLQIETKEGSQRVALPTVSVPPAQARVRVIEANQPPVIIRQEDLTNLQRGEVRTTSLRVTTDQNTTTTPRNAEWTPISNHPLAQTGGADAQVWQGPGANGLIWGPSVMENGRRKDLTQRDAASYCINLNPADQRDAISQAVREGTLPESGCFLPRQEDFEAMRVSMGARPGISLRNPNRPQGYRPQIFSDLSRLFWSSSHFYDGGVYFVGIAGMIVGSHQGELPFRCVCRVR